MKRVSFLLLFFVLLFFLLFLGDGKQEIVDAVGVAGVLCLLIIRKMSGKLAVAPLKTVNVLWAGLLVYFIIRTVFSDSVGYSIYATLRWVVAYCVFALFSTKEKLEGSFSSALVWFGAAATVAAVVVTAFEWPARMIPGMNLLYPNYGHNHIANIIVFVFPLVLYRILEKKNIQNTLLFVLLCLGLVFSFARGAWILMSAYLIYFLFTNRKVSPRMKGALFMIACVVIGMFATLLVIRQIPAKFAVGRVFQKQIIKDSPTNNRLPYWKQAYSAIRERPIFGAGPGTFYLLSKRFQDAPNGYSWYAHSFPLETFAETGLIGLFGLIGLIWFSLRNANRGPLLQGAVLTLLYSFFEMNLNFLVIWLLLWAALGVLYRAREAAQKKSYMFSFSIFFLVCFYVLTIIGESTVLFRGARRAIVYVAPFHTAKMLTFLDTTKDITPKERSVIEFFHRKDPEVFMANVSALVRSQNIYQSYQVYTMAKTMDPLNTEADQQYLRTLFQHKQYQMYGKVLDTYLKQAFPQLKESQIRFDNPLLVESYANSPLSDIVLRSDVPGERLSVFLYLLGLDVVQRSPQLAERLWVIARNNLVYWSYFHIELASLAKHALHDEVKAQEYIDYCLQYEFARDYCSYVTVKSVGDIGSLKSDIMRVVTQ